VGLGRAAILGVLLLAPALGQAQLAECQVLGSGSGTYKVVMDELSLAAGAGAGSAATVNLKELLAFNLVTQLEEFRRDVAALGVSPAVELGLINCPGPSAVTQRHRVHAAAGRDTQRSAGSRRIVGHVACRQ
jgi:hypothetical protein